MKHLYLASLLLTAFSFAQSSFNSDTYVVSRNDIATNTFETDSTAAALIIYEDGNSYIDKDTYTLKTEIKRKIKILKRHGFDRATTSIYLYSDSKRKEKVSRIFATTYNIENGAITKTELKSDDIFEEKYNDKYTIIKFTLPNIQEGSVLTYSYLLESPFIYKFHPWEFQDEIPTLYSAYNTSIPGNYEYSIKLVGTQKLDKNESKLVKKCLNAFNGSSADCANTTYVMTNIPAFVEEDFMTTKNNYLSRLEYELKVFRGFDGSVDNITKSWKDADKELKSDESLGRQIGKGTSLEEVIADVLSDKANGLAVAKDIYNYVQQHYVWNGEYKIFSDVSVKNLIKTKSGKISEINLLLHNLLEEHGIEVKPVLMSTRDNGLPTQLFPVISEFNYLIVQAKIGTESYLLDATDPYLSFGELPFRCLNQYGRLLDFKNGSEWIPIEANKTSGSQYQVDLKISDQLVKGNVKATYYGYDALNKKKDYFENESSYIDHIANAQSEITITDHEVQVTKKNAEEFAETYHIELNDKNTTNDMVYINPFIYKSFEENPFKLQQRTYPIDFGYKKSYLYSVQIDFGDTYELVEVPKEVNAKIPNDGGDIILYTTVNEQKLILTFKLNFTESLYSADYYGTFKAYVDKVLDVQRNSLVVLKRK
ncbi:hypothetical protein LX77_01843 [Gelidibacter algens]|uniref:Transglutaminase superfamily protein n=1 Tax=Gelidibacter algens TaxID=49280 RepID=A0A1A7R477_9FLAO|nr:DUF3857 domain-containing protein [Gelidibacter algens]OBX26274.1 hypothetical protein A9996_05720 [Gelidibacter algens]RAJ24844.1 hypothetical protein LX77_01843 [Gelidibacter algens]